MYLWQNSVLGLIGVSYIFIRKHQLKIANYNTTVWKQFGPHCALSWKSICYLFQKLSQKISEGSAEWPIIPGVTAPLILIKEMFSTILYLIHQNSSDLCDNFFRWKKTGKKNIFLRIFWKLCNYRTYTTCNYMTRIGIGDNINWIVCCKISIIIPALPTYFFLKNILSR